MSPKSLRQKAYEAWACYERGVIIGDLDDVTEAVRKWWPDAYWEGSVGLARYYTSPHAERSTLIAYTWSSGRRRPDNRLRWHYLIFTYPHYY